MRELTCIVCPIGCSLLVEASEESLKKGAAPDLAITGNRCPRGAAYAQEEIRAPRRTVTATCEIGLPPADAARRSLTAPHRLPVKTSAPCPKEKIGKLLSDIYCLEVSLPIKTGDRLIVNWNNSGIDVVATRTLE